MRFESVWKQNRWRISINRTLWFGFWLSKPRPCHSTENWTKSPSLTGSNWSHGSKICRLNPKNHPTFDLRSNPFCLKWKYKCEVTFRSTKTHFTLGLVMSSIKLGEGRNLYRSSLTHSYQPANRFEVRKCPT